MQCSHSKKRITTITTRNKKLTKKEEGIQAMSSNTIAKLWRYYKI
jgi:hypothetical protein